VLTRVAGQPVGDAGDILAVLADRKAGAEVSVEYVRDRAVRTATVTLTAARQPRMGFGGWWVPAPGFAEPESLPRP